MELLLLCFLETVLPILLLSSIHPATETPTQHLEENKNNCKSLNGKRSALYWKNRKVLTSVKWNLKMRISTEAQEEYKKTRIFSCFKWGRIKSDFFSFFFSSPFQANQMMLEVVKNLSCVRSALQKRPRRRNASTRTCVGWGIGADRPVNIKAALTFPPLLISSTLNWTTSSQQQMLLHCQMAYKAHSAALILSVASIKNWIEADKIRLCLQDLKKTKSLIWASA